MYRAVVIRTRRGFFKRSLSTCASVDENVRLSKLIASFKNYGHLMAELDPLGIAVEDPMRAPYRESDVDVLQPKHFGLDSSTRSSLEKLYWIGDDLEPVLPGNQEHALGDILRVLRKVYCGKIGVQFMHVIHQDCLQWLDRRMLEWGSADYARPLDKSDKLSILDSIAGATIFEEYCGARFSGAKRFSLEGSEALIPGLEALLRQSSQIGVRSVEMGMTHRGRLNVLHNVMGMPLETLLYEFEKYLPDDDEHPNNSDDVRYHLGTSVKRAFGSSTLRMSLAANPSHLESVNSVVLGKTRARQFLIRGDTVEDDSGSVLFRRRGSVDYSPGDHAKKEAMGLLLHGDASFFIGSVREVLGFSGLRDYTTGGTIHVILNNQIGFTTLPKEAHSSVYCSDVALSTGAPVFHVNGDDPESVVRVCQTAAEYRQKFGRDCVVNMWCYRRHGHNEQDDPGVTQPLMYKVVDHLPKLMDLYGQRLIHEGHLSESEVDNRVKAIADRMQLKDQEGKGQTKQGVTWNELGLLSKASNEARARKELLKTIETGVDEALLRSYGRAIFSLPEETEFSAHPKVRSMFQQRLKSIDVDSGRSIRWATAEALAFATLLADGFHIRLSGQDVERGTFNQRHAVIVDQKRAENGVENIYKPWTALQMLEWHEEDIRQDLVRRASGTMYSSSAPSSSSHVSPSQEVDPEDLEDDARYVGHYFFPWEDEENEQRKDEAAVVAGPYEFSSPAKNRIQVEVQDEVERITASAHRRASQIRASRRALRWREVGNQRNKNPELGVMEVCNSPLSEEAVLGFEHGYSLYSPAILPLWEAQFGDFSNCAQVMIDTFIANGEDKWARSSGVVLLLPHGYDGQGPDHSSARVERFLQLCSDPEEPRPFPGEFEDSRLSLATVNMHVLNPSTPAQYFHALRRQMVYPVRKPLVIFTPKYLLHHKPCASSLDELGPDFEFRSVLPDPVHEYGNRAVQRVILCSGKIYYHLYQKRQALGLEDKCALIRIEQLCPFPFRDLKRALSTFSCDTLEIVWAQEEPQNMGAWTYVQPRLRYTLNNMGGDSPERWRREGEKPFLYVGRSYAASPATGSFEQHREEMARIVSKALSGDLSFQL